MSKPKCKICGTIKEVYPFTEGICLKCRDKEIDEYNKSCEGRKYSFEQFCIDRKKGVFSDFFGD